jgi:hypothetical protein
MRKIENLAKAIPCQLRHFEVYAKRDTLSLLENDKIWGIMVL